MSIDLFDFPKKKFEKEITKIIHESKNVKIEKILSDGHTTSWQDQEKAEWVCLLEGKAELEFEDGKKKLKKGDSILILPHEKHRVSKTTKCVWLCVFFEFEAIKTHYVYILECADKTLYCGYTDDLEKRIATHNLGKGAKYTKSRLPVNLVYYEEFMTKEKAMQREYAIKKLSKREKIDLIENKTKV